MSIQFSRLHSTISPFHKPIPYIEGQKLCNQCGIRAAGIEAKDRARSPRFHNYGGKS